MSLEDQIRQMGDTRAAELTTLSWRDHVHSSRRRWPVLVATAAVVAVLAGAAIMLLPSDEPETEVADSPAASPTTTEPFATTSFLPASTTTTEAVTTNSIALTQTGICAANPVPSDDVLDIATHIAFDRTPLDLDQDGIDDEMLIYDDADGNWFLLARLQAGWTNAAALGRPASPGLMNTGDGLPAATDLDGNGGLEFFIGGYGNTARTSAPVSLDGCSLETVQFENAPGELMTGWVLHGVGGGSCAPSGCHPRVSCIDGSLLLEVVQPTDEWRGVGDADPASVVVAWHSTPYKVSGGTAVAGESTTVEFPLLDLPADAPGPDDSDVIDCSP